MFSILVLPFGLDTSDHAQVNKNHPIKLLNFFTGATNKLRPASLSDKFNSIIICYRNRSNSLIFVCSIARKI